MYCSELYKSQFTIHKLQYDEVINGVSNMKMSMQKNQLGNKTDFWLSKVKNFVQ